VISLLLFCVFLDRDAQDSSFAKRENVISFVLWRILFVAALFLGAVFGMFEWSLADGYAIDFARTACINTLTTFEVVYYLSARFLRASSFSCESLRQLWPAVISAFVVFGLQALMTFAPFMQYVFRTTDIDGTTILRIFALSVALFVVLEFEKLVQRLIMRFRARRRQPANAEV
jgi:magnesium-transporting ATPase (P-type)